ncbi:MAG: DUF4465 domain-containing protein [Marinilabiliaceae bacterium]|nr:DUF4465 domain-containing protein [Marinilabiliaceae bacterium]
MADYNMQTFKKTFLALLTGVIIITIFTKCEEEKEIPAPQIFSNMPEEGYNINIDDTLTLTPQITYDYNTEYEWIENGVIIATTKEFEFIPSDLSTKNLTFKVLSPRGNDSYSFIINTLKIINFEKLELKKDTFWNASNGEKGFYSNDIFFTSKFDSINYWTGFVYSNKSTKTKDTRYLSCTASGAEKSNNYLVLSDNDTTAHKIIFPVKNHYILKNIQVINSFYTNNKINDVVNYITTFTLSFKGFKDGILTVDKIVNLAANRNNYGNSWKTIELESLGEINELEINLKITPDSLQIPKIICLDNLSIKQITSQLSFQYE